MSFGSGLHMQVCRICARSRGGRGGETNDKELECTNEMKIVDWQTGSHQSLSISWDPVVNNKASSLWSHQLKCTRLSTNWFKCALIEVHSVNSTLQKCWTGAQLKLTPICFEKFKSSINSHFIVCFSVNVTTLEWKIASDLS